MSKPQAVGVYMVEVRDSWDPFLLAVLKTFGFVPAPLLRFVNQAIERGERGG